MDIVPLTSATLLRNLGDDANHPRWSEFVSAYHPTMEAYLVERFPGLDSEEIIQETLIELVRILPNYVYSPADRGSFHDFLTGVVRHKALKAIRGDRNRRNRHDKYYEQEALADRGVAEDTGWREAMFEIALRQFMADDAFDARTKSIFSRVAMDGEKPDAVAIAYGIRRNAVDQIKFRCVKRLREIVAELQRMSVD